MLAHEPRAGVTLTLQGNGLYLESMEAQAWVQAQSLHASTDGPAGAWATGSPSETQLRASHDPTDRWLIRSSGTSGERRLSERLQIGRAHV